MFLFLKPTFNAWKNRQGKGTTNGFFAENSKLKYLASRPSPAQNDPNLEGF